MPRNYKRKSNRCISQQAIETAIREVTIHNKTVYSVARDLNIPKTSLLRYIKKKQYGSPENMEKIGGYSKPRLGFSGTQEAQLTAYVKESANIYFGLTPREVRKLAYQCAVSFNVEHPEAWHRNKQAGPDWFASFLRRHSSLSVRIPEATSLARATSFNKENVNKFFTKLGEVLDRYHFTAAHIYNVDETGITTVQKPRSIVATKGLKQVGAITSAERGSLITMCLAVNAIGNVVPPMLVFPRVNYRDYFISNGPPCSIGVANKSGWMIAEHFLAYMKHFVEYARPSKEKPVLLLLDNHESHLDINVVEYAKQNGVVLLSFPPHCSHKLQPLDRSVYGPLKNAVATQQDNWMRTNPGHPMTIYDLPAILREALPQVTTHQNIVKGFAVAGIFPFNPQIFTDMDYSPSYVTDRPYEVPITDDVIQSGACIEESKSGAPDIPANANVVTNIDTDEWELISRQLEIKQLAIENVPGDGHCLLYAVVRSLEAQGIKVLPVEKLCERLLDEVQNHLPYYETFGTNSQDILTDINKYVAKKQYNNNTCDLIMAALCNSMLITTIVTRVHATLILEITQSPGHPGLPADGLPTVNVALHGDHYRAVVPLAHERLMEHNTINNETTTDDAQPVEVLTTSTTSDQLTSNPVLANITVVNNGSSETSCDYTEPMKMFSPHSVRPFPKAGERKTTKGGRKQRKPAILTDTPEKQALENEQKLKKTKDPKPNLVRKRLSLKRRPQKTKVNRSSKTARQDCFCLVCGEPYSNIKSGEQWIQCFGCEDWSHVQCVPSGPGYTCHNCDIDESDFIH